jgi:hypothetical protein
MDLRDSESAESADGIMVELPGIFMVWTVLAINIQWACVFC